jgi:mannose-6-phosphate isomerase-like protein (cupin superfamily)
MLADARSINLAAALAAFDEKWSPRIVGRVNDYDVRIAKVEGEYVWHQHDNTDEFFLVIEGQLAIGLRDATGEYEVILNPGETYTVPRHTQHRPASAQGASILMFELSGTLTTGNYEGAIPDHIDSTIGHDLTIEPVG